jgi:hypothetical protein
MAHPLLEEFCRARSELRADFFRRCQRVFRDEIIPQLNEIELLRAENVALKAQLEERPRGRKAKDAAEVVAS